MALITTSAAVARISGNIGAINFARTRSGQVARLGLRRTRQDTKAQLDQRVAMHNARIEWVKLTDQERAAWNTAARGHPRPNRLGVRRVITGSQLFSGLLCTRGWEVLEFWQHPPRMKMSTQPYNVTIVETAGPVYTLNWDPYTNILSKSAQLFGARPFSTQPHAYNKYWKFLGIRRPATDPWDVYQITVDALGTPQSGEILYFKLRHWTYNFLPSVSTEVTLTVS